ncbi:hypothetical protein AGMMS50212_11150 [Spirochaetia bacterium]|nr:hypothetical protein AGMMS50212_11150 [Spirochaetia bacterium]
MRKRLKPCPICGGTVGVQITNAINGNNKKTYCGICWGEQCRHKLPTEWYEKKKDAVAAWNSLTEIIKNNASLKELIRKLSSQNYHHDFVS